MAKGPGPALFLAAAAAFMLMGKKKETPVVVGDGTATGDASADDDADVGGGPVGGGSSGGGSGSSQPSNPPPNLSGNSAGYNTTMYPSPLEVRKDLEFMGYSIPLNNEPVGSKDVSNPVAQAFQAHYNQASALGFHGAKGELKMDGWMGKNALNALEVLVRYEEGDGPDNWAAMNP